MTQTPKRTIQTSNQTVHIGLGEPLLTDQRLSRVAGRLVVEYPKLLDYETEFATWVQPQQEAVVQGVVQNLPPVAIFAMVSPNPKHPEAQQLSSAGMWLSVWRVEDKTFQRMNEKTDPALKFYRLLAKSHMDILDNLVALVD